MNRLIHTLLKRKYLLLSLVGVGLLGLIIYASSKPVYYGYTALLKPPKLGQLIVNPSSATKNFRSYDVSRRDQNAQPNQNPDLEVYLLFRYGPSADENKIGMPYLYEVKSHPGSTYLELIGYGETLDGAKSLLMQILSDLQEEFKPRMTTYVSETQAQIKELENQINERQTQMKEIERSIRTLGFLPQLLEQKQQHTMTLLSLNTMHQDLKASILPINISNYTYEILQPVSQRAVYPNYKKLYLIGIAGVLFFSVYAILFLEALLNEKRRLSHPSEATGIAKEAA